MAELLLSLHATMALLRLRAGGQRLGSSAACLFRYLYATCTHARGDYAGVLF